MPSRDLVHRLVALPSVNPSTITTSTNGAFVDTLGYEAVTLYVQIAAIGGTSPSFTPKIQTSADGSTGIVDVDASAYIGGVAPAAMTANGTALIGVQSATGLGQQMLRFIRAVFTVSGTTPTGAVIALFILGYPRHSGVAV
jgi:hypothetical protein